MQGLDMVLCPWKARQEPTAAEGTTASFLCSLDLHPWCVCGQWKTGAAFLGGHFPCSKSQECLQCGPASVSPAHLHPCGCCRSTEWGQPCAGMAVEDTRWQQWAVSAERSRALPLPAPCVPTATPASPALGPTEPRPPPRSGQGCGQGGNERCR